MTPNNKKELEVAALENGTVIDHIPSDKLFKVVSLLGIDKQKHGITIGNNLDSKKLGKKGIIKVADTFFEESEINKIAILAPSAKINVIRNYEVTEKHTVSLPKVLRNIIKCGNPKCVTNNEPMGTCFYLIEEDDTLAVKCHYCERVITKDNIEIA